MARRRYGRRRRGHKSIPVLSLAIIVGQALLANASSSNPVEKLNFFQSMYTGMDFTGPDAGFKPTQLVLGWGPWVAKGFVGRLARGVGARPRLFPGLSLS